MTSRLTAFGIWTLLACSCVYWAIQLLARPMAAPASTLPVHEQSPAPADLTRLFGAPVVTAAATAVEVPADARFKLLGVVAPKSEHARQMGEGVALIAVDGVPRTVRVGAKVDGELLLLAVAGHTASLGQANGVVTIKLQTPAPVPGSSAQTNDLPPVAPPVMPAVVPPLPENPSQQQPTPNGAMSPTARQ